MTGQLQWRHVECRPLVARIVEYAHCVATRDNPVLVKDPAFDPAPRNRGLSAVEVVPEVAAGDMRAEP